MPKPASLRAYLLLACLSIISASNAQTLPREVSFEQIAIPGTIRSSQVTNIIQDEVGLMWLAGHGLYRYDGFRFRQYKELANGKGIFNPYDINYLLNDSRQHRILLGTRRFGIVEYNYATDQLNSITPAAIPPIVNMLAQGHDGTIWAGSYASGLFRLEGDSLVKFTSSKYEIVHPSSMLTHDSVLYVGELGKIFLIKKRQISDAITIEWEGRDVSAYNQVTALHFDQEGNLWVGTEKQGVFLYDPDTKKFIRHFPPTEAPFFSRISMIHQDHDGLVWILTKASGLAIYSPRENKIMRLIKDPFSQKSISSDNCFSIAEDRHGIIWIGATGDINKYDRQQTKFKHIFHNALERLSLTDNMVRGVCEDSNGKVWIGTDGGYINVLDLNAETTETIPVSLGKNSGTIVPLFFAELNKREMLVASSSGLLVFDRHKKTFKLFEPLRQITGKRIIRQVVVDDNRLYFIYNGILYFHDLDSGETKIFNKAGNNDAINITAICLDEKKRLWVGSNKGVSLFRPETSNFTFIPFPDLPVAIDGSLLLVLSIQQAGNKLFVGTFNMGLWELDISDIDHIPPPKHYGTQEGLPSNTIYASLPSDDKNLWLSTNTGIVLFQRHAEKFIPFSITEGLQEEEFNRLAYARLSDGKMIFGGINGINLFDPAKIRISEEIFVPEILSATFTNPLDKEPRDERYSAFNDPIRLEAHQNFATFHFFVPYFKQPKRYTLFYKLQNFDKAWREVNVENVATYSNLAPGAYTFLVKTVAVDGKENYAQANFIIAPPYWQTWWFILLSLLIVSFFVMTIIRSYIRKAQFDRQRLEILLKLRTAEIERSKEELQILNQKKDLIFSILSHDLRSPLTTLKGFLGFLITNAHELSTEELQRHAINIKNSVTNSLDLIDNTLFWSLSQMGNIQYTPTNFSLTHLVDKLKGLYQLTADKKRIPLTVLCEDEIMVYGDENMIYVTLRNLVSNALKFTGEGNPVKFTAEAKDDYVEINVIDTGIGMSEEYLQKIMSMDQPMLKKGTSNEKGTGLGLLLCKKFIELNQGELIIKSVEHKGTTFTVILPLAMNYHPAQAIQDVEK